MRNIISVAPAAGVAQASTGQGGRPVEWPPASRWHRLGLAFPGLALEAALSVCLGAACLWGLICGSPSSRGAGRGKRGVYLAAATKPGCARFVRAVWPGRWLSGVLSWARPSLWP